MVATSVINSIRLIITRAISVLHKFDLFTVYNIPDLFWRAGLDGSALDKATADTTV